MPSSRAKPSKKTTPAPGPASSTDAVSRPPDPLTTAGPVISLALDEIELEENHRDPRLQQEGMSALKASLVKHGQITPVIVNLLDDGGSRRHVLIAGHRRYQACRELGRTTIRAEIRSNLGRSDVLAIRAIENLQRRDLKVMEEAVAVEQLLNSAQGSTIEQAAAWLSQTVEWTRDRMYLAQRITGKARKIALERPLGAGHLRQLAKIGDPSTQASVADDACYVGSNGRIQLQGVDFVKKQVELHTRSLRGVRWELDAKVARKGPCIGCPHNSATDAVLFETPENAGAGFCLNRTCFEAKTRAADEAVKLTVEKLRKAKQEPTAEAIDQAKPAWLRRAPVQRVAKLQLGSAGGGKSGKANASGGRSARGQGAEDPGNSPLDRALSQYDEALRKWSYHVADLLFQRVTAHPPLRVGWDFIARWPYPDLGLNTSSGTGRSWRCGQPASKYMQRRLPDPVLPTTPEFESHVVDALRQLHELPAEAIPEAILNLLPDADEPDNDVLWGASPIQLKAAAQAVGVDAPDYPAWEAFNPAAAEPKVPTQPAPPAPKKKRKAVAHV